MFDKTDKLLIAATRGRGVWVVPNADQTLATSGVLEMIGDDSVSNAFVLNRDPELRGLLEVQVALGPADIEQRVVELTTLEQILVVGNRGEDVLTIITTNGIIETPLGIFFDGGADGDVLEYLLTPGDTLVRLPSTTGLHAVQGSRGSSLGQFVLFQDVELDPTVTRLPTTERDSLTALRHGLVATAGWSDELARELALPLPVIGRSLGNALEGAVGVVNPISDAPVRTTQSQTGTRKPGPRLLRQLLENGQGAFPLSDIGDAITTLAALRDRFDAMDDVPENVSFVETEDGVKFDLTVIKTLAGRAGRRTGNSAGRFPR